MTLFPLTQLLPSTNYDEFKQFGTNFVRKAFNETRKKWNWVIVITEYLNSLQFCSFFKNRNFFSCAVKRSSFQGGLDDDISSANASRSKQNLPKWWRFSDPETLCYNEDDLDAKIVHKNQPVMTANFLEPITENEKVYIVATLRRRFWHGFHSCV